MYFKTKSFKLQFFEALLIINLVAAGIPVNEIEIEVVDNVSGSTASFVQRFREAMASTDQAILNIKIATSPSKALAFIPQIGNAASGGITALLDWYTGVMWKDGLYRAIGNEIERTTAENKLIDVSAKLKTISQHFNQLRTNQLSNADVTSKLHIIHDHFMEILNLYSEDRVIFKKYPQYSITPLSSFAVLFKIFEPLREKFIPNIQSKSMACRAQDLFEAYAKLHVFHRMTHIDFLNKCRAVDNWVTNNVCKTKIHISSQKFLEKNYNSNGYLSSTHINCNRDCDTSKEDLFYCFQDQGKMYEESNRTNLLYTFGDDCLSGYKNLLRHRIESAYYKSRNTLNDICTNNVRQLRQTTGYGWLTIIFSWAHGKYLPDGRPCDQPPILRHIFGNLEGLSLDFCDLYIKVKIGNQEVFRTRVEANQEDVLFNEIYQSTKIAKNQHFELNLRDEDAGSDDSLVRVNGEIGGLQTGRMAYKNNCFDIIVYWRDEYKDEH